MLITHLPPPAIHVLLAIDFYLHFLLAIQLQPAIQLHLLPAIDARHGKKRRA
jgi:hypothetical protein